MIRITGKYIGKFEGVSVYESTVMGQGFNSAGMALPGRGIIVGKDTYSKGCDLEVVKHEYGHFLQARKTGYIYFYLFVGLPSLVSALTNGFGLGHQNFWTEKWANFLAQDYFNKEEWPMRRFPSRDIKERTKKWLVIY